MFFPFSFYTFRVYIARFTIPSNVVYHFSLSYIGFFFSSFFFFLFLFLFITNKRQPRFAMHSHAHTRHSPYKKFRVGKYKWNSTVYLSFCFIFSFFFLFLFLSWNLFLRLLGSKRQSFHYILKSLSLFLIFSHSLPFVLTRAYNFPHSRFIFFPFFFHISSTSFVICLHVFITLSRLESLKLHFFLVFFSF